MHLTEATYRGLLDATLQGAEARALGLHLAQTCEQCEQFLERRPSADALDAAVDTALQALRPGGAAGAGHELEFARIQRAVRGEPKPRRRTLALAVAATLAVAGLAGLLVGRAPAPGPVWDGEKGGSGSAVPLRLRFLVMLPGEGGPPVLQRGISGQEVPAVASLQFQVELGRPAQVLLARIGASGDPEVFLSARLPGGRNVVSLDGQPAAYPLSSLAGPQRFLALASDAPLGPADAVRAASLAAGPRQDGGPAITIDLVEVRVRP
jgi:hypothetical protein